MSGNSPSESDSIGWVDAATERFASGLTCLLMGGRREPWPSCSDTASASRFVVLPSSSIDWGYGWRMVAPSGWVRTQSTPKPVHRSQANEVSPIHLSFLLLQLSHAVAFGLFGNLARAGPGPDTHSQILWPFRHCEQLGFCSSHLTFLARQVRHPVVVRCIDSLS